MNHHPTGLSHLLHSVRTAPDHGSPDRNAVAAENLSAASLDPTPSELAAVQARYKAEGRARVRAKVDEIDAKNKGTPRTRLPWEN